MKIVFLKSFHKSIRSLHQKDKEKVKQACETLIRLLESEASGYKGLVLKHLMDSYWEIRVGLKLRIIFSWEEDLLKFILLGSHDAIKKFLKENV